MPHARSSLRAIRLAVTGATVLLCAAGATVASAQQLSPKRLAHEAGAVIPTAGAASILARDSVAHYLHVASVQRRTGTSLALAGLAAVTVAYVQYARSGELGMNGAQLAAVAGGAAVGFAGGIRLSASRESLAIAARWKEAQLTAQR